MASDAVTATAIGGVIWLTRKLRKLPMLPQSLRSGPTTIPPCRPRPNQGRTSLTRTTTTTCPPLPFLSP